MQMFVLSWWKRLGPVALVSLSALHCGSPPGPDGEVDQSGGNSSGTGGDNLGGEAGDASVDGPSSGGGGSGGTSTGAGGSGGTSTGGEGGASGGATGEAVELPLRTIDQVDVLFVVDNSISMADKQALLEQAVPKLLERLVAPDCIDLDDGTRTPSSNLSCQPGAVLEMAPIDDLHIGVITSSMGGFGANGICTTADDADKARLIPKVRTGAPDPNGLGFLEWSGGAESDVAGLSSDFAAQVDAIGEFGCGFEAPLEAWYRFLIDPSPPESIQLVSNTATSTGVDQSILEQRAEFLRPGSLVAIVMLTDEDDCSGMEGGGYYPNSGYGWLVPNIQRPFAAASEECAGNPNDPCCYSCLMDEAPEGCVDSCQRDTSGNGEELPAEDDRANVRCHQNSRRFGIDLLYPISRYIDGLSKTTIVDTQATTDPDDPVLVPNPLLRGAALDPSERQVRPPNQVFLAGIVGVPWQDIATPATREDPDALEYMDADGLRLPVAELGGQDRWALILGQPNLPTSALECQGTTPSAACGAAPIPPLDPFMIDSISPRSGTNPITGDAIVPPGAAAWSPINGSEYDNSVAWVDGQPSNDDLQYACIFPLGDAVKADCSEDDATCDCGTEPDKDRPLCKAPGSLASAPATTTQHWGKAYPAKRLLQVLEGFGSGSIVASICPKILDEPESPYFGYGPALDAIVQRLAGTRGGICLTDNRDWDETMGDDSCAIVEATAVPMDCEREGRAPLSEDLTSDARAFLEEEGHCSEDSSLPCDDFGLCMLTSVSDPEPCFDATPPADQPAGYCLIDPAEGPAFGGQGEGCTEDPDSWDDCSNANSAFCPASEGRMIRFVGVDTPTKGAVVFRVCAAE